MNNGWRAKRSCQYALLSRAAAACYNTASGCPCFGLRATPFMFLETACQLLTAVFVRTRTLALCYGHGLHRHYMACYTTTQKPPLRGTGSESRCARVFTGPGFRVSSDGSSACETCYNTASGCPCLDVRATPLGIGKTVRRLSPAVFRLTGAFTPCCGHGLDHQRRQARQGSDKPHHLNNQVHGQLTSFLQRRRCQHTGLIPLTSSNYIIKSNIRSLLPHIDSNRKAA